MSDGRVEQPVRCGRCGVALDESPGTPVVKRQPCHSCGSMARAQSVNIRRSAAFGGNLAGGVAAKRTVDWVALAATWAVIGGGTLGPALTVSLPVGAAVPLLLVGSLSLFLGFLVVILVTSQAISSVVPPLAARRWFQSTRNFLITVTLSVPRGLAWAYGHLAWWFLKPALRQGTVSSSELQALGSRVESVEAAIAGLYASSLRPRDSREGPRAELPAGFVFGAITHPNPVESGETVAVMGWGFAPGPVSLTMPALDGMEVGAPVADAAEGFFYFEVPLMTDTPVGAYEVVCTDTTGKSTSTWFNVAPAH